MEKDKNMIESKGENEKITDIKTSNGQKFNSVTDWANSIISGQTECPKDICDLVAEIKQVSQEMQNLQTKMMEMEKFFIEKNGVARYLSGKIIKALEKIEDKKN